MVHCCGARRIPRGRKHVYQPSSHEQQWRPHRRLLEPAPSGDDTTHATGKRPIRPNPSGGLHRAEARHNGPAQARSGYDDPEILFPFAPKAPVYWPAKAAGSEWNGGNARNFVSKERILEVELGMKVKMGGGRAQLRNSIGQKNPGDKSYSHVDYSPKFFLDEGLVPGACIQTRRKPKTMVVLQSGLGDETGVDFRKQPSYEERIRAQVLRDEISSVEILKIPDGGGNANADEDSDDEY